MIHSSLWATFPLHRLWSHSVEIKYDGVFVTTSSVKLNVKRQGLLCSPYTLRLQFLTGSCLHRWASGLQLITFTFATDWRRTEQLINTESRFFINCWLQSTARLPGFTPAGIYCAEPSLRTVLEGTVMLYRGTCQFSLCLSLICFFLSNLLWCPFPIRVLMGIDN